MNAWQQLVAANAVTHREEIEADLAQAIQFREHARANFEEVDGRVRALRYLLAQADELQGGAPEGAAQLKLHEAMIKVLEADPVGMMRAVHLAAAINERGLYLMQDGRPVEGQQVTARVGRYPHLFEKEGTFIKIKAD